MDAPLPKAQRTSTILFVAAAAALIAIAVGVGLAVRYFGSGAAQPGEPPLSSLDAPASFTRPVGREWVLLGIIRTVDAENGFFELEIVPAYPVSLEQIGYNNLIRVYFGSGTEIANVVAETERGAIVKFRRSEPPANRNLSLIVPGKPVRAVGEFGSDGTYRATSISTFDFFPR